MWSPRLPIDLPDTLPGNPNSIFRREFTGGDNGIMP